MKFSFFRLYTTFIYMNILKIIILFYSAVGLAFGSDHGYFPENYKDSRAKFLNESQKIKSLFGENASLKSFETPSLQKEKLFTDFLYIDCRQYAPKNNSASKPLILLTSGVHGPESRVGTAAQIWFLQNEAEKRCKAGISQIYFHSLNPFGFHHDRRFTENNVDLNRNFPTSDDIYENENAGYKNLEEILNPKKPVGSLLLRSASLFKKLLGKLVGGLDQAAIRQASVGGQYEYPKGIYFGGNHPEPVVKFVSIALKESFRNHSDVLHYDFHTGLGEKGILHMIVGPSLSGYGGEKIEKVFKPLSTGRFEL
ncbi:MAG: M14 family metallopeptidase, partial [Halobacteriovoraceae bacterium]|nr:M14 family metallopeptidase [Halobacteriovoraceae bacterium]